MAEPSRTQKSARNALVGVATQATTVLLSFIVRTVFITHLGVELLGVQTLLASVLAIAALADLGMGTAFMYALYQPLKEGDSSKTSAIVRYANRLYNWAAVGTFGLGLAVLPFVPKLVSLETPVPQLNLYYLVLLVGAALAFTMHSRTILLEADQKSYIAKLIKFGVTVVQTGVQIAVLIIFESFLAFLVIQTVATLLTNLFVYLYVTRTYPEIRHKSELGKRERRDVSSSIRAMIIYRLSGLALNNTDPILISVIVGTAALGYFSNYLLILGAIVMVLEIAFGALTPSLGNLVAGRSAERMQSVFTELQLLSVAIYGVFAVALILGLGDFIELWLGDGFELPWAVLVTAVMNFYLVGSMTPIGAYRAVTGMFRRTKYVLLVTAALNILVSIWLGIEMGLVGILLATILARLLTNFWYEPFILFRDYMQGGGRQFVIIQVAGLLLISLSIGSIHYLSESLGLNGLAAVLIKPSAGAILFTLLFFVTFGRNGEIKTMFRRVSELRVRKGREPGSESEA